MSRFLLKFPHQFLHFSIFTINTLSFNVLYFFQKHFYKGLLTYLWHFYKGLLAYLWHFYKGLLTYLWHFYKGLLA